MAYHIVTCNPGTLPDTGTSYSYAMRASTVYGGLTITDVMVVTGVVGTLNVALINCGTAGTVPANPGTIAGMADGTATVWAADTPQSMTITPANAFVDAGEYVVIKKVESAAANDLSADAAVIIEYVDGIVTQA